MTKRFLEVFEYHCDNNCGKAVLGEYGEPCWFKSMEYVADMATDQDWWKSSECKLYCQDCWHWCEKDNGDEIRAGKGTECCFGSAA